MVSNFFKNCSDLNLKYLLILISCVICRGEFDVIKELLESVPECAEGKVLADKMIDMCGVPPEGTGLQNIRSVW